MKCLSQAFHIFKVLSHALLFKGCLFKVMLWFIFFQFVFKVMLCFVSLFVFKAMLCFISVFVFKVMLCFIYFQLFF